jgi:hypothetical protein
LGLCITNDCDREYSNVKSKEDTVQDNFTKGEKSRVILQEREQIVGLYITSEE